MAVLLFPKKEGSSRGQRGYWFQGSKSDGVGQQKRFLSFNQIASLHNQVADRETPPDYWVFRRHLRTGDAKICAKIPHWAIEEVHSKMQSDLHALCDRFDRASFALDQPPSYLKMPKTLTVSLKPLPAPDAITYN